MEELKEQTNWEEGNVPDIPGLDSMTLNEAVAALTKYYKEQLPVDEGATLEELLKKYVIY